MLENLARTETRNEFKNKITEELRENLTEETKDINTEWEVFKNKTN
jgi:hypothetical protein